MYDFLDKIGLKTALEQIKAKFPSSLPANGGNADTVGGKSASDFVLALTEAQTVNARILIPDNVDVVDWLIKNAKIGTVYFCAAYSSGQSNLPLGDGNNNWTWFTYDGNRFLARAMVSDSSTRDFLLNKVNLIGGWKEISTTPIKSSVFGMTTNGQAWVDTGLPVATTKIISVLCSTQSMVGHVWQLGEYSTWCASFYYTSNVATPVPNTPVSFTIYYFEE